MLYTKDTTEGNHLKISIPENIIGLILFFVGLNVLIGQIPSKFSYAVLFLAAFSLFIGLVFIVDTFLYNSLSSVLPGFLLTTFSIFVILDFLFAFPISYASIITLSILFGGSCAFAFLSKETSKKSIALTTWVFIVLLLLQLISKIPLINRYFLNFWPIALVLIGVFLLINIYKKRN